MRVCMCAMCFDSKIIIKINENITQFRIKKKKNYVKNIIEKIYIYIHGYVLQFYQHKEK